MSITEFHLSKTDFKEPATSKDAEAIAVLIVRLILLEPGTIQSHPEMGVGLISKYRYRINNKEDNVIDSFISDLNYQIDKFLPIARGVKLSGNLDDEKLLTIYILINNSLYKAVYDQSAAKDYITLEELKDTKGDYY